MGMYDSIYHELKCPVTQTSKEREIQVKWIGRGAETLRVGDRTGFAGNMGSLWIREEYVCGKCQTEMDKKYPGWRTPQKNGGFAYHPPEACSNGQPNSDEYHHPVFINLQAGRIAEITDFDEFRNRGLQDFIDGDELACF